MKQIHHLLFFSLLLAVICSFFILIKSLSSKENRGFLNTWQFPMLLAIFLDMIYYSKMKL